MKTPRSLRLCVSIFLQPTNHLAQTEPLMPRALAIFEVSLGAEHSNTLTVKQNYQLLPDKMKK